MNEVMKEDIIEKTKELLPKGQVYRAGARAQIGIRKKAVAAVFQSLTPEQHEEFAEEARARNQRPPSLESQRQFVPSPHCLSEMHSSF
jgi:hypothetical protein